MALSDEQQQELQGRVNERRQREFTRRGTFTIKDFKPPTELGLFDFAYNPTAREIKVRVTAHFNVVNRTFDPPRSDSWLSWIYTERALFQDEAKRVIRDRWSHRYRMVCRDPEWSHLSAAVDIALEEVPRHEAHYIIDCRKVPTNADGAWAGGCEHTKRPYRANFSNWGVEERIDFFGDKIFNLKEKQLVDRLKAHSLGFVKMKHGSEAVANDDQERLKQFAREVTRILDSDVTGIQCSIYGCSTELSGSKRAVARGQAVAAILCNEAPKYANFFVADRGAVTRQRAEEVARALGKKLGQLSGAILFVHVPPASLRKVNTHYIIITHEFGHMLGCPDEYVGVNCTGTEQLMGLNDIIPATLKTNVAPRGDLERIEDGRHFSSERMTAVAKKDEDAQRRFRMQKQFASQIEQAGVEAPLFMVSGASVNADDYQQGKQEWEQKRAQLKQKYGPDHKKVTNFNKTDYPVVLLQGGSDSIMWSGQKVQAAHYLPIWSALGTATREFIDPTSWKIEPA
jgi:hypothetical protein